MTALLGLLDWGIGGLDVLTKLRAADVGTPVLYVSDAGAVPYGKLARPMLARRVAALVEALAAQGCTQVILACNAASTVLGEPAVTDAAAGLERLLGVIEPGIVATKQSGVDDVVVLGGARTVASGLYGTALRPAGLRVREVIAQPLSGLIEAGVLEGPQLTATVQSIVAPVRDATTIVSACTHYLAAEAALRAALPELQTIIDPAAALVAQHFAAVEAGVGPDRFWTTGDPATSQRSAAAAFAFDAPFEAAGDRLPAP